MKRIVYDSYFAYKFWLNYLREMMYSEYSINERPLIE